jgi:hypothetical protein
MINQFIFKIIILTLKIGNFFSHSLKDLIQFKKKKKENLNHSYKFIYVKIIYFVK